jgi:hypothetical protein
MNVLIVAYWSMPIGLVTVLISLAVAGMNGFDGVIVKKAIPFTLTGVGLVLIAAAVILS